MFMQRYRVPGTGPACRRAEFHSDAPGVLGFGLRGWVEFAGQQPAAAGSLCYGEPAGRPELLGLAEATRNVAGGLSGELFVCRGTFSDRRTPGVVRTQRLSDRRDGEPDRPVRQRRSRPDSRLRLRWLRRPNAGAVC